MTHVKKKHMTRWGLEPGTYHRPCKYSDHLANGPHDEPASSTIYTAGSLYSFQGLFGHHQTLRKKRFSCDGAHMKES